ncbi:MAG: carbohydrate kinase family protein [Nitrospirae bacterium CG_4_10_14_0_8_um_filter_41_23]|nr:carbohydrate kinase family protein [Nitrospirota bacterium]OIP59389.1 MAG: carbohydrate kinase family protein [Nitrospirae bacterium CG2_30_41_42]PIQ94447.1 MAG: carbohydrate kinase family protein [Nitrospirae bacterium CG11_big_fil_rev_8_21_14_0_20_41_14]PIV42124.1 MAG: carbohydrate kinase family protein [Nitrospirae bacterium CG02_land_8_20_14_3_00_41_53]PIW86429.1 MAG: carbohydrate kinase family protein [Nitrospirae bacterium CG_4_8_14_3_um_filter_41_47]PIY87872.1 MAG: carbohydrate kinas
MNIYISGSMAYDRIMDFPGKLSDHILPDKIHILNVCFTVNGMVEKFGGTAGNIAYSLSLLNERAVIIATIGKDYQIYFDWLKRNNISEEGIKIINEEFTAGAYIITDKTDNQITGFNPGAMKYPSEYKFENADPGTSIGVIGPGNLQDMIKYARICKDKGINYICDPGQSLTQWEGKPLIEWLDGSMLLISNDYELEMIMKITGMDKKRLKGLTKIIITTLGEKGSLISNPDFDVSIPAPKVHDVVDPTGAGDAFRAGLLKGIVIGRNIETAAKMGTVAAAYALEKYGTQEHQYTYEDFVERYKSNFGEL